MLKKSIFREVFHVFIKISTKDVRTFRLQIVRISYIVS